MTHPAFSLVRTEYIPSLNLNFEEYRHLVTGARHFHLACEDTNNVFLVAFLTVPQDSMGVAHILEHTTLCGSERYPVRDPFFLMMRRSLNTFMNAFTSADWTTYPFASQTPKDFYNLLQVYLDCVFFPQLNPLDFAQEGCRLEFSEVNNPDSPLQYKGVVYNEMKGAMSSSMQAIWYALAEHLFPTTTYHYNSGGKPEDIPQLTHQALVEFHHSHYHPSNAIFMTYGDLPVADHHAYFENCALSRFQALNQTWEVPDEQRYTAPKHAEIEFSIAATTESIDELIAEKSQVLVAWLTGHCTDLLEVLRLNMLAGVLLDNSSSPLRYALETTELGEALASLSGLEDSLREVLFICGLEDADANQAEAIEQLILNTLTTIAEQGVEQQQIEAVLHQMELQQREVTGDGMPYGLQLLLQGLQPALHKGDPLAFLNIDNALEQLRQEAQQPDFIQNLVKRYLLNNPHRLTLVAKPNPQLAEQQEQRERAILDDLQQRLSAQEKAQIIEQAKILADYQQQESAVELLPKVGIEDINEEYPLPTSTQRAIADLPSTWFATGTNGMVYAQWIIDLPQLDNELIDLLPLFCEFLTEVGCNGEDYLTTSTRQAMTVGSLRANLSVRCLPSDPQMLQAFFVLSAKALMRNHQAMAELMRDTLFTARFDEHSRLRELISQERVAVDQMITERAHQFVLNAACSGMNPNGNLNNRWHGFASVQTVRQLDKQLAEDKTAVQRLAANFARIQALLMAAPLQTLIVSEEQQQATLYQSFSQCWQPLKSAQLPEYRPFRTIPYKRSIKQAWTTATPVNFCAKTYPAVGIEHRDAPALIVLGDFLRNGFLHHKIREQGGAYGSNAGYDSNIGAFRIFSYRDPRLVETLTDFDAALHWLQTNAHEERQLEEAILNVIGRFDRPVSPAGDAISTFFASLHGRSPEQRRELRKRILSIKIEDLQQVAFTYLQKSSENVVVMTDAKTLQLTQLDLELNQI